ncbi:MAG: efflux RND transporter permease subunit [Bacteroidales bacterium]
MKAITRFSVNYPVSVSMIILATLLLGIISFNKLGIDLFPNLHSPRLYIELVAGERPPEEMEEKFVDGVESLAIRQSGVVNVYSTSRVGVALIEVEYTWEKDMNEAFLDLSKALSSFNQDGELEEINITQYDPNATPVMLVALGHTETSDLNELRKTAENYVRNELIRLEGIADVEVDGAEELEVLVETNDHLLHAFNLDISALTSKIQSYNQDISGGSIVEMGKRYIVRGISELEQVRDLEEIIVKMGESADGSGEQVPVLLREVATVSYHLKEQENAVLLNGKACVGLSIYKEMRYNTVKAVEDLKAALVDMERALPGFTFTIVQDQGKYISSSIGEVSNSLIGGIGLAIFVLFLFLRRLGPTLIVSVAIPVSIIATFVLMYFNGLTLNIMTLGGLALGAGMLVDNAIVVLENIFRHHEQGADADEAAMNGTSQVGGAIIASTLTTIVVFIPIVYLRGASGELFREQAFTVAFSLLASLVVAILIIPMLYSKIYRKNSPFTGRRRQSVQFNGYGRFLDKILNYRGWVLLVSLLLMAGGWFMLKQTGSEFMPGTEAREFYVDLQMPEGTQLERTSGAVQSLEGIIGELTGEELDLLYSEIGPISGLTGGGENLFDDQNMATIKVKLKPGSRMSVPGLIGILTDQFGDNPNFSALFRQEESALSAILGTDDSPLVVEVSGEEMDELETLTQEVMAHLVEIPGIRNITSSIEGGAPEVEIVIDRYRAGLMNVDVNTLISRVSEKLQGADAGQMTLKGDLTDITVKLHDITLQELEMLSVEVNGTEILLREIAGIRVGNSPREILHSNQNRIVKITADLDNDLPLDRVAATIDSRLEDVVFPPQYSYKITGEEALRKESMGSLGFALLLSLILVYMVMAAQFESLIHPFTILLPIPLAVVGAVAVFYIQGASLNIMALIGIILLVGIAVNDSIILVDAINQFRMEGMKLRRAIVSAGQYRIRPILMTSLTTILALLPLTLGFGEGASLRSPMAWAVIGGLTTSTTLTLVVIPCIYMVFGQWGKKYRNQEIAAIE